MAIRAVCPGCRGVYNLDDRACGQTVRCKYCHEVFKVESEPTVLEEADPIPVLEAAPGALQAQPSAPRPHAAASVPPKRKPAPVQKASPSAVWWIVGGVAAAVLLLLLLVGGLGVFVFLRVQAADEAAAAERKARGSKFQAKQPFEKVDDWNNKPNQNLPPFPPGGREGVPPGGPIVPPPKPVEPPSVGQVDCHAAGRERSAGIASF